MAKICPYCAPRVRTSEIRTHVVGAGRFWRKSDSRWVRRFLCKECGKHFSRATMHPCRNQKKRQFNNKIFKTLCSNMSIRRLSREFGLSRTTIARKINFLGLWAQIKLDESNLDSIPAQIIEFDDMETFEHTKCKPLSITLAVEHRTRRILGFKVARMPAKGLLTKKAKRKYGKRIDERTKARRELFSHLKPLISENALFRSDQNPYYPKDLKCYFPNSTHERYQGQRGSIVGQGELKKIRFDPLFSINHTCAMLRANVNRLIRKTWCTTKSPQNLTHHIAMYALYHNLFLLNQNRPAG